jgi:hypothetical protein
MVFTRAFGETGQGRETESEPPVVWEKGAWKTLLMWGGGFVQGSVVTLFRLGE